VSDVSIAFASTGYGPVWPPAVSSWLRAVGYGARYFNVEHIGKIGGAGVTDRQYTHMAENALVSDFLASANTHLFLTEADMILPHDVLPLLYETSETGKDMVSGVYFLRANKPEERGQPCLFKRPEMTNPSDPWGQVPVTVFPMDRPFRVDCAGVGCVLIKRHVLETVTYPWFDLSAQKYGSDMFFYAKAREAGFMLWADPRVQAQQIDYYITDVEDYRARLEREPEFTSRGFLAGITGRAAT
jgi:hypothetical protein